MGVLARKLAIGGSYVIREQMRPSHGMPFEEIRTLMAANGLKEMSSELGKWEFSAIYEEKYMGFVIIYDS